MRYHIQITTKPHTAAQVAYFLVAHPGVSPGLTGPAAERMVFGVT
jgi:hypothetical protein